jgi:translation initiation factor 1 (eIF-1/SUI1)
MSNSSEDHLTNKTQEIPVADPCQKELRRSEYDKRLFITTHRRELRKIVQALTNLADRIPDIKTQIAIFKELLPANRTVLNDVVPDSIKGQLENLNLVAESIAAKLGGQEVAVEINSVKTAIGSIISIIPE